MYLKVKEGLLLNYFENMNSYRNLLVKRDTTKVLNPIQVLHAVSLKSKVFLQAVKIFLKICPQLPSQSPILGVFGNPRIKSIYKIFPNVLGKEQGGIQSSVLTCCLTRLACLTNLATSHLSLGQKYIPSKVAIVLSRPV